MVDTVVPLYGAVLAGEWPAEGPNIWYGTQGRNAGFGSPSMQWENDSDSTGGTAIWHGYYDSTYTGLSTGLECAIAPVAVAPAVSSLTVLVRARLRPVSPPAYGDTGLLNGDGVLVAAAGGGGAVMVGAGTVAAQSTGGAARATEWDGPPGGVPPYRLTLSVRNPEHELVAAIDFSYGLDWFPSEQQGVALPVAGSAKLADAFARGARIQAHVYNDQPTITYDEVWADVFKVEITAHGTSPQLVQPPEALSLPAGVSVAVTGTVKASIPRPDGYTSARAYNLCPYDDTTAILAWQSYEASGSQYLQIRCVRIVDGELTLGPINQHLSSVNDPMYGIMFAGNYVVVDIATGKIQTYSVNASTLALTLINETLRPFTSTYDNSSRLGVGIRLHPLDANTVAITNARSQATSRGEICFGRWDGAAWAFSPITTHPETNAAIGSQNYFCGAVFSSTELVWCDYNNATAQYRYFVASGAYPTAPTITKLNQSLFQTNLITTEMKVTPSGILRAVTCAPGLSTPRTVSNQYDWNYLTLTLAGGVVTESAPTLIEAQPTPGVSRTAHSLILGHFGTDVMAARADQVSNSILGQDVTTPATWPVEMLNGQLPFLADWSRSAASTGKAFFFAGADKYNYELFVRAVYELSVPPVPIITLDAVTSAARFKGTRR